jgi:hypothetical protein
MEDTVRLKGVPIARFVATNLPALLRDPVVTNYRQWFSQIVAP